MLDSYNTEKKEWHHSSGRFARGFVTAGTLHASNDKRVVTTKTFTSPKAGNLVINPGKAKILGKQSDGVAIAVYLNDTIIWPANGKAHIIAPEQKEYATPKVETAVNAGDKLRFAVSNVEKAAGDLLSWQTSLVIKE